MRRKQDTNTYNDRISVRRAPHENMWRINSYYKDSKEAQISNINEVSKDDDEHNSVVNISGILCGGKKYEDVKEYIDEDEDEDEGDEEGYSDDCGIFF